VTAGVAVASVGPSASGSSAAAAPVSATVKVLGPTAIMKQVKDASSAASRTGVSLQQVLIRPGAALTTSAQTGTIEATAASMAGISRTSGGAAAAVTSTSSTMLPGVQQAVQDIVQQAQAQAARQNTVGFVTTSSTASFPQQPAASMVTSPSPSVSVVSPASAIQTAADAAAAAAIAAASQNKSSPYVMRLRNQRS